MQLTVGERIRKIRKDNNLTQESFAESIGTSKTNLANIEKDKTKPGFEIIGAIIDLYPVDAAWLINGRDKMAIVHETKVDPIQSMASWMAKIEREIYMIQKKLA